MKRIASLVAVGVAAAVAAVAAQAKEVQSLKVCGASGCTSVTDPSVLSNWEPATNTDPAQVQVATPQSFYTVEIGFGGRGEPAHVETAYWLRDTGLMRFQGQVTDPWWKVFPNQQSLYAKAATGLQPFAPHLASAKVGGKKVADPDSYQRLLGAFPYTTFPNGKLHLIRIVLRPSGDNPWLLGTTVIRYDAKRRLLLRPDGYFRVPKSLGRKVMKRASLAPAPSGSSSSAGGSGSGRHMTLYAGVGAGLLVALGVLGFAGRKKMH